MIIQLDAQLDKFLSSQSAASEAELFTEGEDVAELILVRQGDDTLTPLELFL